MDSRSKIIANMISIALQVTLGILLGVAMFFLHLLTVSK